MSNEMNRRILLIDDTPSIHEDFRKILGGEGSAAQSALADAKAAFFGDGDAGAPEGTAFELESAYQGQEGLELLLAARREDRPFAMAFVDVRMPPGWDGIQTIKQLWKVDDELQVVICTAYSDYSWEQTMAELGQSDRLLILKKPCDPVEIRQLAHALTEKWNASRREARLIEDLRQKEAEARAYASSLETMNQALATAKAISEKASEMKSEFLVRLSAQVNENLASILERVSRSREFADLAEVMDSSRSLMRTLDGILDLTRVQAGELPLQVEPCDVLDLAKDVLEQFRGPAGAKRVVLALDVPRPLPERIACDARRVREILVQLVDNAVQFTDEGEVRVRLCMEPTSDWQVSRLTISVIDTGVGLPKELEGRIYEPFVRQTGGSGAGLGLALTRNLARLMGGDACHERCPQGGTRFDVSLEVGTVSGVKMVHG